MAVVRFVFAILAAFRPRALVAVIKLNEKAGMPITLTFPPGAALVSGGTGRVGEGVTRRLAEAGVPVVFTFRGNAARADEIARELVDAGYAARATAMDLTDPDSVDAAIALATEFGGGRLQTVVSAGGPMVPFARLADIPYDVLERFVLEDAMGIFRLLSKCVAVFRGRGGSIVACTTIANFRVVDYDGVSPFSKGSIEAFVRQIAAEEAQAGIRANCVPVSWVNQLDPQAQIDQMADIPEPERGHIIALIRQIDAQTRLGRPATIGEAGDLFAFLASDQARYITGQSIRLDGGFSL